MSALTATPAVDLSRTLKRAAVAYGVMSGALERVPVPVHVALGFHWENGTAIIDIGDARTARLVASLLDLPAQESPSPLMHTWAGRYADRHVIVIGRGRLSDGPDDARRDAVAESRRRGLVAGAAWDGVL